MSLKEFSKWVNELIKQGYWYKDVYLLEDDSVFDVESIDFDT